MRYGALEWSTGPLFQVSVPEEVVENVLAPVVAARAPGSAVGRMPSWAVTPMRWPALSLTISAWAGPGAANVASVTTQARQKTIHARGEITASESSFNGRVPSRPPECYRQVRAGL